MLDNSSKLIFDINHIWLNSKEAASYLRVSVGQLRNLVWQKKIPHYHFGGRLRFSKDELSALMSSPNK